MKLRTILSAPPGAPFADALLAAADETESLASAAATLTVAGGTVRRG